MPIYEFVCRECGSEFEQLMSFSAHGHPPCPACASQHVSRKIGRPAIHFKGSGWYVTDSKGSKQSANGGEKESAGDGESKAGDKPTEISAEKSGEKSGAKSGEKDASGAGSAAGESDGADKGATAKSGAPKAGAPKAEGAASAS
jgi:putative FmdB family regulatory protein